LREREATVAMTEEDRHLGREDRHADVHEQGNRCKPGQEPDHEQRAADDLDPADERTHQVGAGMPMRAKRPAPITAGRRNLKSFFEEHEPHEQANEDHRPRGVPRPPSRCVPSSRIPSLTASRLADKRRHEV
jgi:hypothetical protein